MNKQLAKILNKSYKNRWIKIYYDNGYIIDGLFRRFVYGLVMTAIKGGEDNRMPKATIGFCMRDDGILKVEDSKDNIIWEAAD